MPEDYLFELIASQGVTDGEDLFVKGMLKIIDALHTMVIHTVIKGHSRDWEREQEVWRNNGL